MTTRAPRTTGIHHTGLTVPELATTRSFFEEALGFEAIGEVPDYPAVFLSDGAGMITLWQASDPETARPFDRHGTIGLHHLALRVDGANTLDELHDEIADRTDCKVEFAPEPLGEGPTRHCMLAIPGGIRLELIAPANAES